MMMTMIMLIMMKRLALENLKDEDWINLWEWEIIDPIFKIEV